MRARREGLDIDGARSMRLRHALYISIGVARDCVTSTARLSDELGLVRTTDQGGTPRLKETRKRTARQARGPAQALMRSGQRDARRFGDPPRPVETHPHGRSA